MDDELSAVAVVLWQSSYYRNVITVGITDLRLPHETYPSEVSSLVTVVDTGANIIRGGFWHVGPQVTADVPLEVSMRRVANQIWMNDQPIRDAVDDDYQADSRIGVYGDGNGRYLHTLLGWERPRRQTAGPELIRYVGSLSQLSAFMARWLELSG